MMIYLLKCAIFYSYIKQPEGTSSYILSGSGTPTAATWKRSSHATTSEFSS